VVKHSMYASYVSVENRCDCREGLETAINAEVWDYGALRKYALTYRLDHIVLQVKWNT